MKTFNIKYLTIFLLLVSVSTVNAAVIVNDATLNPDETTIAELYTYWKLTGEITNTYPYSVFISIPEDIEYSLKSLGTPKDTTILVGTAYAPYLIETGDDEYRNNFV